MRVKGVSANFEVVEENNILSTLDVEVVKFISLDLRLTVLLCLYVFLHPSASCEILVMYQAYVHVYIAAIKKILTVYLRWRNSSLDEITVLNPLSRCLGDFSFLPH